MVLLRLMIIALSILFCEAQAFSFTGQVISVLDGQTIDILHNGKTQRIRLHGIACPEKDQPFGNNAKETISHALFAMEVTLQIHGKDKHGRILADVLLADGTNVSHELVKEGWCWWYRKFAPDDTVLEGLENEAREASKGLWADSNPVPPWEWRKRK